MASTLREVHPVRTIDGAALPAAPGRAHAGRGEPDPRAHRAGAGRLRLTLARPHRHREPAAVRQGRGGLARCCAPSTTSCSCTPASTTTTSCRRSSSPSSASRAPSASSGIHGGTNTEQTARMLAALGPLVAERAPRRRARLRRHELDAGRRAGRRAGARSRSPTWRPACARSTARCPRSSTASLTDHLSDLLLCPSPTAVANLEREHVAGRDRARRRRDGRRGAALRSRARAPTTAPLRAAGVSRGRVRAGHRAPRGQRRRPGAAARAGRPAARAARCRSSCRCTRAPARAWRRPGWLGELEAAAHVRLLAPLGYVAFTALLSRARAVLTDSGGVQKEAYLAGVPCVTMRDTTEWVETVDVGLERAGRPRRRRGAGRAGAHAAGRAPRALRRRARGRARRRGARAALSAQPPPMRRSATPAAAKRAPSSRPRPSTTARTPGRSSGPRAV